jgi:RNA polymerase sigma-70 factor (ECF subfamily)
MAHFNVVTESGTSVSASGLAERRSVFEAVALPHFPEIHRTAMRVTGHRPLADDLTQEVFLQAWKAFDRFQPGTNCKAWLMTILFYTYKQQHRKTWRYQIVSWCSEHDDLITSPPLELPNKPDRALVRALNTLPSTHKAVVILAEIHEYSYREISTILRVPIGTVMSRLSRSKQRLRELVLEASPRGPSSSELE